MCKRGVEVDGGFGGGHVGEVIGHALFCLSVSVSGLARRVNTTGNVMGSKPTLDSADVMRCRGVLQPDRDCSISSRVAKVPWPGDFW